MSLASPASQRNLNQIKFKLTCQTHRTPQTRQTLLLSLQSAFDDAAHSVGIRHFGCEIERATV
jgi:hypothetical protein